MNGPEFKYLYRYNSHRVSCGDEEYGYYSRIEAYLYRYKILKETPKGCWIERAFDKPRFVLNEGRKKFACRTPELALESFKARKAAQVRILNARIAAALQGVAEAERDYARRKKTPNDYWSVNGLA